MFEEQANNYRQELTKTSMELMQKNSELDFLKNNYEAKFNDL